MEEEKRLRLDGEEYLPDRTDEVLVIELEDLPPEEPGGSEYEETGGPLMYPGMPPGFSSVGVPVKGQGPMVQSNVSQNLLAGLVGGILAWLINELVFGDSGSNQGGLYLLLHAAVWAGMLGGLMGTALGAAEGVATRISPLALRGGAIGMGIGLLGGMIGGLCGQFIYSLLGGGMGWNLGTQILARTLGWGLMGLFIGLVQGATFRSGKKAVNGLIGGIAGGLLGGLLFDFIGALSGGGSLSRFLALALMGGAIGGSIGMVDEIRKEAWLRIIAGPMAGKEYILFKDVTSVGSSPKCDIVVYHDPGVAPLQATITANRGRYTLANRMPATPVLVNGRPVSTCFLTGRQQLRLGQTTFEFHLKK